MDTARLVGYWPSRGDCRDASGHGHQSLNHGVDLAKALFSGRDSDIAVAPSESLRFGGGSFAISAWIDTARDVQGAIGDIVSKHDSQRRKGFSLCVKSTAGGYGSQGDDRHLYSGIDDGRAGGRLALYVNGELAASSLSAGCADCQVSNDEPLKVGPGGVGHFS